MPLAQNHDHMFFSGLPSKVAGMNSSKSADSTKNRIQSSPNQRQLTCSFSTSSQSRTKFHLLSLQGTNSPTSYFAAFTQVLGLAKHYIISHVTKLAFDGR